MSDENVYAFGLLFSVETTMFQPMAFPALRWTHGFERIIFCFMLMSLSLVSSDGNVALGKPANQSGALTRPGRTFTADLAVDGSLAEASVAIPDADQVNYTDHAVWWVDLLDTYRVQNITIYNTVGSVWGPESLRYFILSVGPNLEELTRCTEQEYMDNIPKGGHVTIPCNQVGRIVYFRKTGNSNDVNPQRATLREVKVYGELQDNGNLALGKPANQSGALNLPGRTFTADLAVDGSLAEASVAIPDADHVNYTDHAVWWVDLLDTYRVRNITIYNAVGSTGEPESLRYFILSVGPNLDELTNCMEQEYVDNIPRGGHVTIPCNQVGRIVHFRKTGNSNDVNSQRATLREVQVYGELQDTSAVDPGPNVAVIASAVVVPSVVIVTVAVSVYLSRHSVYLVRQSSEHTSYNFNKMETTSESIRMMTSITSILMRFFICYL